MKNSQTRIGLVLILALFVFSNINCGGAPKKVVDPNAPRAVKEFSAEGGSSSKDTGEEPGQVSITAQCPGDYPILVECKKWWAETGTAGKDPFTMKGPNGAKQNKTENACICEARHSQRKKDFFGISNSYVKCGVTAVCANK